MPPTAPIPVFPTSTTPLVTIALGGDADATVLDRDNDGRSDHSGRGARAMLR